MKLTDNRKIVIAIIVLILAIVLFTIVDKVSGATGKWHERATGVIVDVDPINGTSQAGLFFEINGRKDNKWLWIWQNDFTKPWPQRGDVGSFYTRKVDGDDKYKWVEATIKSAAKKKKADITPTIKTKSLTWSSVIAGLPPFNKTVLVKYKNGVTITTAYINVKKQWKLETDRDRVSGGREITTIAQWRNIRE